MRLPTVQKMLRERLAAQGKQRGGKPHKPGGARYHAHVAMTVEERHLRARQPGGSTIRKTHAANLLLVIKLC
jgi:hypothetical protein